METFNETLDISKNTKEALDHIDNFCNSYLKTIAKILNLHNNCKTIEDKNLIQELNLQLKNENSRELFDRFLKLAFKYNTELLLIQKTLNIKNETN